MLFEITESNYPVVLSLNYATTNNITGQVLYPTARCFLAEVARPIWDKTVDLCAKQGWTIKVFDAFRPSDTQHKLWQACPNPMYVCPPDKGSNHTRGVAIDLNILENGQEWNMGTMFDDLSVAAHHGTPMSQEVEYNRFRLLGLMMTAGWDFYQNEWWHYQLFNAREHPLIQTNWWDDTAQVA